MSGASARKRKREEEMKKLEPLRNAKLAEIGQLQKHGKPCIFLIGTTTHGKSTLIKLLYDPDDEENKKKDLAISADASGTTKVPEWYVCKASNGEKYVLVDSSGIGDADVPEAVTICFTNSLFGESQACGALFVNEINQNLGIMSKMMGPMFSKCVTGGFDNILLVCTKCDTWAKGEKEKQARMKDLAEAFEDKFESMPGSVWATAYNDKHSIDALKKRMEAMLPTKVNYKLGDANVVADAICKEMGLPANSEENAALRAQVANLSKQMDSIRKSQKATAKALSKLQKNKGIFAGTLGALPIPGLPLAAKAIDEAIAGSGSEPEC